MNIKKALIPAAGFGTRFFPWTKSMRKEMLPVWNKPVVDYVVEECIKAGVEEIIFVVNEGHNQIKDYYSESLDIKAYLEKMGKPEKYEQIAGIHKKAKFTYLTQSHALGEPYGTAVPLKIARDGLQSEEAFFVMMGDDFIYHADGTSEASLMKAHFFEANAEGLASFIYRPDDELQKYGVAKVRTVGEHQFLEKLVEKPQPGSAPSNLANVSKYIFTPKIFEALAEQQVNAIHGELLLTDTVEILAAKASVVAHTISGEFLDVGSPQSWLAANNRLAANQK